MDSERLRGRFVYDPSGESEDAFSATMGEVCAALKYTDGLPYKCELGNGYRPICEPAAAGAGGASRIGRSYWGRCKSYRGQSSNEGGVINWMSKLNKLKMEKNAKPYTTTNKHIKNDFRQIGLRSPSI